MNEKLDFTATPAEVLALALQQGLALEPTSFVYNETGLDFQVIHALDTQQNPWILRMPRRADVLPRAENERNVLRWLQGKLPVQVPDWQVDHPRLIAYPLLPGTPVANIDMEQKQYLWNLDPENLPTAFLTSLGQTLAVLHALPPQAAAQAQLKITSPGQVQETLKQQMWRVKKEIGVAEDLWQQWQTWLTYSSYWPTHTCLVHGDLQAAHILTDAAGRVTGLLDWTEAEVHDPAIDFVPLQACYGEPATQAIMNAYQAAGGQVWPRMLAHVQQRQAAYGVNIGLYVLESGTDDYLPMARQTLGLKAES